MGTETHRTSDSSPIKMMIKKYVVGVLWLLFTVGVFAQSGGQVQTVPSATAPATIPFTAGIPAETSPVTLTGGDDGFGAAAMVVSSADGYIPWVFTSQTDFNFPRVSFSTPGFSTFLGIGPTGINAGTTNPDTTVDQPSFQFDTGNATATANGGDFKVTLGTAGGSGRNGGMFITSGGLGTNIQDGVVRAVAFVTTARDFSELPSCSSELEGMTRAVDDSTTDTWGATITGGDSKHVQAYCNGTNWTVAAK